MGKLNMAATLLMLMFVSIVEAQVFDIGKYGGAPNSDIAQALISAYKEACASTSPSKVVVPKGTYNLSPVTFEGPCKAPIEFQIQGTLIAATEKTTEPSWVSFNHIDKLTVSGGGVFDGLGPKAWGTCGRNAYCKNLPIVPSKVKISGVTFKNIKGTSSTPIAVKLSCSSGFPCQGVEIADIDLTYTGKEAPAALSQCINVQPKVSGKMNPPACNAPISAN
ncbi:hypothetical protein Dsin_031769 [Dipteronia sinensis]|uniref:Polygalacturonase n=1 Tax=Dipteronia sinensis TaxID=43782 RepID=A0AAD9ZMJ4_9ROSI|nr:hypothetical protein Dsin_031769 [Dipteronia sinensis]